MNITNPCGSGLARESGLSATSDVRWTAVISEQARSHRGFVSSTKTLGIASQVCGSEPLSAKAVFQPPPMLNGTAVIAQQASLPQGVSCRGTNRGHRLVNCGSGLARESGVVSPSDVEWTTVIAEQARSHRAFLSSIKTVGIASQMWERSLLAKAVCQPPPMLNGPPSSRAGLAPTGGLCRAQKLWALPVRMWE